MCIRDRAEQKGFHEDILSLSKKVSHNVEIIRSDSINHHSVIKKMEILSPEFTIYSGFGGQIVCPELLSVSRFLHAHAGWLPDYRGSTTSYYSLIDRNDCAVSVIELSPEIDKGDILSRKRYNPPELGMDIDYVYDNQIRASLLTETLVNYSKNKSNVSRYQPIKNSEEYLFQNYKNKIITPGADEIIRNNPSRSAKLRYAIRSEKIFFYPHDLKNKFKNVEGHIIKLDNVFDNFKNSLSNFKNNHGLANSRARLRMTTLYQVAASNNGIVVGTGNKVEDFGVGFYTKYGDGGVDISPIADCTKTQVWEMGKSLGIIKEIIEAEPTDGLWDDGRTDTNQLGMSYDELEKAMMDKTSKGYSKYLEIRKKNLHKMNPIPVCMMEDE